MAVTLWRVSRWRCNEVILWLSSESRLETPLWDRHDCCIARSHQMTSQLSQSQSLRWLIFRDSTGHCEHCFVTSHTTTSFWCHIRIRHKAIMMESPNDDQMTGTRYIVTSLWLFTSYSLGDLTVESRNDGHLKVE